jgi:hypothetical protein
MEVKAMSLGTILLIILIIFLLGGFSGRFGGYGYGFGHGGVGVIGAISSSSWCWCCLAACERRCPKFSQAPFRSRKIRRSCAVVKQINVNG